MAPTRKLTTTLAITLFGASLALGQAKSDRDKANLRGSVRSVESIIIKTFDANEEESGITKSLDTVVYDLDGNEIERTIYDDFGFLVGREARSYAAGKLSDSVLKDPKGHLIEKRTYQHNGNRLIKILTYGKSGALELIQSNSYDAEDRLLNETYAAGKRVFGQTVFKYNDRGRISEVGFFGANGAKAVAPIGPCLSAHRMIYTYDAQNHPITIVSYEPSGELKKRWKYTYDSEGEKKEDVQESFWSLTKFVFEYEYDSHGNWIKRTTTTFNKSKTFNDDSTESKSVTKRVIKYY